MDENIVVKCPQGHYDIKNCMMGDTPSFALTFYLRHMHDPVLRTGLMGLYRAVTYGPLDPTRYPGLAEQEGRREYDVDHDACTLTIRFSDMAALSEMMNSQVGDFRDGLMVPPGYPTDVSDPSIKMTQRAHLGIIRFFGTRAGGKGRSKSRGNKAPKLQLKSSAESWSDYIAHDMIQAKDQFDVHTNFTPDTTTPTNLSGVLHPALAMWNNKPFKAPWPVYFLTSFCLLGYVFSKVMYTQNDKDLGEIGLSPNAPTFEAWDRYIREWIRVADPGVEAHSAKSAGLNLIFADADVGLWAIASVLNLPAGCYSALSTRGHELYQYQMLRQVEVEQRLANMSFLPIRDVVKTQLRNWRGHYPLRVEEKESKIVMKSDAFTQIVWNVRNGLPAYYGMQEILHLPRLSDNIGPWPTRSMKRFTNLLKEGGLMKPHEARVLREFSFTLYRLAQAFEKNRYGGVKEKIGDDAKERALYTFMVALKRSTDYALLFRNISHMIIEHIRPVFVNHSISMEVWDTLCSLPFETAKSLVTTSLVTYIPKESLGKDPATVPNANDLIPSVPKEDLEDEVDTGDDDEDVSGEEDSESDDDDTNNEKEF